MTTSADQHRSAPALAAATLGLPGLDLDDLVAALLTSRVELVELRADSEQPISVELTGRQRRRVRQRFDDAGVTVLAIDSYLRIAAVGPDHQLVGDAIRHAELASDLGARFVRLFPGGGHRLDGLSGADASRRLSGGQATAADQRAVPRLISMSAATTGLDMRFALETHDSHPTGKDLARILDAVAAESPDSRVGAIWDPLHPWRFCEDPAGTAEMLRPYLTGGSGYIQLKDVGSRTDLTPVLPGSGVVPLDSVVSAAEAVGYRGPWSLEWEKAWSPRIPEFAEAMAATRRWWKGRNG
ncbi:MAG: sugar phosphate isomerase/epimerase [Actinomycetota bacterium]|nr:sugar phosphate isomerase/epimerase [Actinomycetota bacterium]